MSKKPTSVPSVRKVIVRSNRKFWSISAIGFLLTAILATWITYGVTKSYESSSNANVSTSAQKIDRAVTGKTADEDRKAALAAATDILNLSGNSPTGTKFDERLNSLDAGDTEVIDPELTKLIRFQDSFADSEDMKNNTYQSLITMSTLIMNATGSLEIKPASDTMWKNVHVDSEMGTAFVPLSIYAGPSASFSMEMVYIDGGWKLAPYSLLDSVKLSAQLQKQLEAASAK